MQRRLKNVLSQQKISSSTYLFVKKIILVECTDKADYDAKVAVLHKDKNLCAVYAAVRVLSHFDKSALGDIPFVR